MGQRRSFSLRKRQVAAVTCALVVLVAGCGDGSTTSVSLDGESGKSEESAGVRSLEALVSESEGVLRGRFQPDPVVVYRNEEEEAGISEAIYVWDFDVTEVLLDRYPPDSEMSKRLATTDASIQIALLASDVEKLRDGRSFEDFHASRPSRYNFNSYPTDTDAVIFTYAAGFPGEVLEKDPSLSSAQVVAGGVSCFDAKTFEGPCLYAADTPGGKEIGRIDSDEVPKFTAEDLTAALADAAPTASEPEGEG